MDWLIFIWFISHWFIYYSFKYQLEYNMSFLSVNLKSFNLNNIQLLSYDLNNNAMGTPYYKTHKIKKVLGESA